MIRSDEPRLQRLLENLGRNSVEDGSTGSRPSADGVIGHGGADVMETVGELAGGFYVEDDGPGIPEDERDRVFESGYSTGEGTGFGLSIVEQIAYGHGWDVRVVEGVEGGARFEFRGVAVVEE